MKKQIQFVEEESVINVCFVEEESVINVCFGELTELTEPFHGEYYEGSYDVTPSVVEQTTLETQEKLMRDNVTVRVVPVYRTSNDTGTTVYIGRKVD